MTPKTMIRFLGWPLTFVMLLALVTMACAIGGGPYEQTFDSLGGWASGNTTDLEGDVQDGVYRFHVKSDVGVFWTTETEEFEDGTYEVEATQVEGPLDNGFGMMFRLEPDPAGGNLDSYYLLEISGDGYLQIIACVEGCTTFDNMIHLVGDGWTQSAAINQGLGATNRLKAVAEGSNLIFYVNDEEVGRATDSRLSSGTIGLMVETLGEGGVIVHFDNFKVTPLAEE
jgi:hypothetical protein